MNRIYLRFLFFFITYKIILSLKKQNWRYLSKNLYNLYIYIYKNIFNYDNCNISCNIFIKIKNCFDTCGVF